MLNLYTATQSLVNLYKCFVKKKYISGHTGPAIIFQRGGGCKYGLKEIRTLKMKVTFVNSINYNLIG
jgi:hypothetical protein